MKTTGCVYSQILAVVFTFVVLTGTTGAGQEVPKGMNYKKTTAEINAKAKVALERALSDAGTPSNFLSEAIYCGRIRWNDLKKG
jgi:hypothetical protein